MGQREREPGRRAGSSDVVSATDQHNSFHSSPLDTNQQIKETSEGVDVAGRWERTETPKGSPQIADRRAGRSQLYLQTDLLVITPSWAPVSLQVCGCSQAWFPAASLDAPSAL